MPLQDLTPQLRTRLNRMERAVGWFVFIATLLLLAGFGDYLYHTAQRKGWFLVPAKFYCYITSASGLKVGDPVVLMGFNVGRVTDIAAMPPRTGHDVRVDFIINQINHSGPTPVPYYSYVWSKGSVVKLNSTDFLGTRGLEITRGTGGFGIYATYPPQTLSLDQVRNLSKPEEWRLAQNVYDANSNLAVRAWSMLVESNVTRIADQKLDSIVAFNVSAHQQKIVAVWNEAEQRYEKFDSTIATNSYELPAAESPAISDQLQAMVLAVKQALPNVLALTNKLYSVLDNAAAATSNLNATIVAAHPLVTNFAAISGDLHGPGTLGVWVLGSNAPIQIDSILTNANSLLVNVNTNLDSLSDQIGLTLVNLANTTSNLNMQVQENPNMLFGINKTVADADDFVQGLKHFWLLRGTFKHRNEAGFTNAPPTKTKYK